MTTQKFSIKIGSDKQGERVDKFLSLEIKGYSRKYFQNLIKAGGIKVNGKATGKDYILKIGDIVEGCAEEPEMASLEPDSKVKFGVVFDGKDFAVIDKPAGLVVHPSHTHKKGTLVNGLLARWPEIRGVGDPSASSGQDNLRPGVAHRLDKETSGLMAVAKSQPMFLWLKKQFQDRKVEKKYIALVYGNIIQNEGEIAVPIGRLGVKQVAINSVNKGLLGNVNKSRNARTGFKILARYSGFTPLEVAVPRSSGLAPKARARLLTGFTLVEATPYTGRMHQIRVHFKYLGYPIVGDKKYAGKRISKVIDLPRHFLHSSYLSFNLPSGERVEFKSELPDELQAVIDQLERF